MHIYYIPIVLILHLNVFNFMRKEQEMRFPRLPKVESHKPRKDAQPSKLFFQEVKMFPTADAT